MTLDQCWANITKIDRKRGQYLFQDSGFSVGAPSSLIAISASDAANPVCNYH